MGDRTGIEWTDATWNPVSGCTRVSAGCDNCYAARLAETRLRQVYLRRSPAVDNPANRHDPFAVRLWPERLDQPMYWDHPRMVFVNSMSDLFHHDIPEEYVCRIFDIMMVADWHVFQVLTKRPGRAARFWKRNRHAYGHVTIPDHIWIGTSVENQGTTYRVDQLRTLSARVRFLSCEPLLGPVRVNLDNIDWVIVGGESGPGYRPIKLEWASAIKDQCESRNVPFFFKQVGGRTPKAGGRQLDGREWSELPYSMRAVA
ncbi:MAG: hypothetical protein AMS18_09460 [Gemmatimonas sp. SG8_17]|nr:MAG: hypothetical protein AMS18_09460 [Gemmatimonas sp. SG8_17]